MTPQLAISILLTIGGAAFFIWAIFMRRRK